MRPCVPRGRRVEVILTMAVSEAIENYLETIYILSEQQNEVHAIDICSYQMRESGLVTVDEDNHVHLTEEGRAIATHIYERHTILSQLLMRLGVTKETALHDACKIEHDLSDETFDAIKRHFQAHQETKR